MWLHFNTSNSNDKNHRHLELMNSSLFANPTKITTWTCVEFDSIKSFVPFWKNDVTDIATDEEVILIRTLKMKEKNSIILNKSNIR